jgi:hypothetical protein
MAGVQQFALDAVWSKATAAELAANFIKICTETLKRSESLCNQVGQGLTQQGVGAI